MRKLRNCEKRECYLRNSYAVISWLIETIELGNRNHKKKATKAEVKTDWETVMTNHFMSYRKKYVQVKRLQSGGRTFKQKYGPK